MRECPRSRKGIPALVLAIALAAAGPAAADKPGKPAKPGKPPHASAGAPVRAVVSPPLRLVRPIVSRTDSHERENERYQPVVAPWYRPQRDPAIPSIRTLTAPTLGAVNFDGLSANGTAPPDTNGRVGPNHYVQWVNTQFEIFDKTGAALYGPADGNTLFSSLGGDCASHNDGDPIAQYDILADRWVLTQFVVGGNPDFSHQCFAVSTGPDPLGSWYLYDFVTHSTDLVDYPHVGIWSDGYYMSAHVFPAFTSGYTGQGYYVFEREQMILGMPARMVMATPDPTVYGALPGDLDSTTPPPAGRANLFFAPGAANWDASAGPVLHVRQAVTSWGATASLTLNSLPDIPVAAWQWDLGCTPTDRDCIPQAPGDGTKLDGIGGQLMYRVAYRNQGAYDTFVLNHTVNTLIPPASQAAVRWYEVRNSASPALFQQGTFAPDATKFRFMGSLAMDNSGNIALGYSRSSSTDHPDIYVAGRLAGDASGTIGVEALMYTSPGSQTGGLQRWGDYTAMTVDPRNGCTFWYQDEYIPSDGSFNWRTRIGTMDFPGQCAAPALGTINGTLYDCSSGYPIPNAVVELDNGYSTAADASGNYSIVVPAGTYFLTAKDPSRLCASSSRFRVTVAAGGTANASICLTGTPKLSAGVPVIDDSLGNGNGTVNQNECIRMTVPLTSVGCASSTGVTASVYTATPGVTVDIGSSVYPDVNTTGTSQNTVPFKFTTSPGFVCGTEIVFTLVVSSSGGTETFTLNVPTCLLPSLASGSLVTGDSTQNIRMFRRDPPPSCGAPRAACLGTSGGAGARFYDTYSFANADVNPRCVTVTLTPRCTGATFIQSAAYLGSYDPTDVCTNYLADIGGSPGDGTAKSYSFDVPAGATFVVVVNEVDPAVSCAAYDLTVLVPDVTQGSGPCTDCATTRPTAVATPTAGAICIAGSTPLSGSGGTTCRWTPTAGLSDPYSCTPVASPAATTTYSLKVIGAGGCESSNTAQATITVNALPSAFASGSATTCPGSGVPLAGSGGVSCSWTPTTGLSDPASCTPIAAPASTTTYTLKVTDASGCQANSFAKDVITDGDFEAGSLSGWTVDGTTPAPVLTTDQAHGGASSVLVGTVTGSTEPLGDSSLYQTVTVPASGATLSFWYWPLSQDIVTYDWQNVEVLSSSGTVLATLMHAADNDQAWKNAAYDMSAYAGQTVRIRFLVYQDGFGDITGMYVDDVKLIGRNPSAVTVTVWPGTQVPTRLHPVQPCRVVDTRGPSGPDGGPALGALRTFPITGSCGIPATARAVAANVTVVSPTSGGDLRLFPAGFAAPGTSTINFLAGQVRASNALLALCGGQVSVKPDMLPGATVHVLIDVSGWFE